MMVTGRPPFVAETLGAMAVEHMESAPAPIDEALARARRTLRWSYEVRRSTTALSLAEAGLGVAVLPEAAVPEGPDTPIVSRPLIELSVSRTIGLVRRTAQPLPKPTEALIEILTVGAAKSSR